MVLCSVKVWVFLILSVLMSEPTQCQQPMKCRPGWLTYSGACYHFNTRYYAKSYEQARQECISYSSSLLEVENESERQWVSSRLMEQANVHFHWIHQPSNNDLGEAQPSRYTLPFADEPDIANGKEMCVVVNRNGYFRNEVCSKLAYGICKVKKPNSTECPIYGLLVDGFDNCYLRSYKSNWMKSEKKCKIIHGHLLSINKNSNELDLIMRALRKKSFPGDWWTGLHYNNQTKEFEFTDGTPYYKNTLPWLTKEIVSDFGSTGCYALTSNGKLTKSDCKDKQAYICKYSLAMHPEGGCPASWHRAGSSCYYFSKPNYANWTQAESACNSMDSHLLKVDAPYEKDWLSLSSQTVWIGLNARSQKGVYVWDDGTKPNNSMIRWSRPTSFEDRCMILQSRRYFFYFERPCYQYLETVACEYRMRSGSQTSCAKGWHSDGHNKCYYFSSGLDVTWYSNIEECKNKSSTLDVNINYITIESKAEESFISATLQSLKLWSPIWLGLNSLAKKDNPVWEGAPGVPSNTISSHLLAKDPRFKCVYLIKGKFFVTSPCYQKKIFICEKEAVAHGRGHRPVMVARHTDVASLVILLYMIYSIFDQF